MDQHNTGRMLSARAISKSFGDVQALRRVSIDIPEGQSVAVMGPSGSGKSTLLHCLAGILRPDSGEVSLGDQPVSLSSDAARSRLRLERMGFVFQDGQLLPELPALENVALPLLLQGRPRAEALARAADWLTRLGLAEAEQHRRPGELSGGQAHRVAIARALVGEPDVVLADEPTGSLDQDTGTEVMQVLTDAVREAGASLVLVTHDEKVATWCERCVVIIDGRIFNDADSDLPAVEPRRVES